jgi:hypothetical protein
MWFLCVFYNIQYTGDIIYVILYMLYYTYNIIRRYNIMEK